MSEEAGYLGVVRQHAESSPASVAFELVRDDQRTVLTYAGLIERVQALGEAFRAAGFGNGERVAICMENRPAWPVAYLAVWYSGGVTVPLDPALDPRTLGRLLAHAGAIACVTSEALRSKLDDALAALDSPPTLLVVDHGGPIPDAEFPRWTGEGTWDGLAATDDDLPGRPRSGNGLPPGWAPAAETAELGSIMYTSGTTGDPKGVMIRRAAVLENLESAIRRVHFTPNDRLLGVLPLFHVLPLITNCLGPLFLGARVIFLYELTAEGIMAAFRRHEITVFVSVPAFFYRFHDRVNAGIQGAPPLRRRLAAAMLWISRRARRHLGLRLGHRLLAAVHRPFGAQMRLFITGGAKMSSAVYDDFLDWGFVLAQGYGLTEATAVLTASPLDALRGDTVGSPIDGVELRIHEPGADGIGEIWASGPSLMMGYYKNPEATNEVLLDGWLRTGDLGRFLDNGHLQVTGRAKDTIVLASGKNIYPDELESYYGQSDLVDEMCIVGIPDEEGRGERLHAAVVPDLEGARRRGYVNVREMIKWELETMGAELPGPQRLTSLEIRTEPLPRTPTHKVKRFVILEEIAARQARAEQKPVADASSQAAVVAGPEEMAEWAQTATTIIARYARVSSVRPEHHLDLDLGLESLDRIELLTELQQRLGVRLSDEVAGEIHTVSELLEAIDGGLGAGSKPADSASSRETDSWEQLLSGTPEGIHAHLRRRPVTELIMFLGLRSTRLLWKLVAGFRSAGQSELPRDAACLLCANHASYSDPFFLAMALPPNQLRRIFFVGYSEYFEGWAGRIFARLIRNIPIDPNRNLERAMQAAAEGLRRGMVLVIFPEGARSLDGEVRPFRRGAAILARNLGAPMVPIGIWGAHRAWPRGGKLRRHPVSIKFGASLKPGAGPASDDERSAELRRRVIALVDDARGL